MKKTIYLLLFLAFKVLGCNGTNEHPKDEKSISITFEEDFVIGASTDDNSSGYENQFSSIASIRTDKRQNVYVADDQTHQIVVFDGDGSYQHTIGGEGQGPGEFQKISDFIVSNDSMLTAFDKLNNRITKFALDGQVLNTISPGQGDFVWPMDVSQINDRGFVLHYKPIERNGYSEQLWETINNRHLHIFDRNFDAVEFSFAEEDSVIANKTGLGTAYSHMFNPGSIFSASTNELWFAPGIYEGSVFKFTIDSDSAYISKKLTGEVKADKVVDEDNQDDDAIAVNMRIDGDLEVFTGSINSESLGIFEMEDGKLIHFSSQLFDNKRRTVAEVFSKDGEFLGSDVLREFSVISGDSHLQSGTAGGAYISDIWKDNQDRFYIADDQELSVVVRAGTINFGSR